MHKIDGGHEHAGRAEAALKRAVFGKQFLQRMHRAAFGETLYGPDFGTVGLQREHQARADRLAVVDYSACSADTVLATHMGAREP